MIIGCRRCLPGVQSLPPHVSGRRSEQGSSHHEDGGLGCSGALSANIRAASFHPKSVRLEARVPPTRLPCGEKSAISRHSTCSKSGPWLKCHLHSDSRPLLAASPGRCEEFGFGSGRGLYLANLRRFSQHRVRVPAPGELREVPDARVREP